LYNLTMKFTVAGLTQQDYLSGLPFWMELPQPSPYNALILGVSHPTEPTDHQALCKRFGDFFQFVLLNDDAVKACEAAGLTLHVLGTVEEAELQGRPSTLLMAKSMRGAGR